MKRLKEIKDDGLHSFTNKRPRENELFNYNNQSLLHVFVHLLIHRNTRSSIMKGTYAIHVIDYIV